MFRKILIANRGEIAVRIERTCREMGIGTVAVFSEADAEALHVRFADEAFCLGGPLPGDSYLKGEAILAIARRSGAGAVHPGFGFLSENPAFARAVGAAGLCFLGPPPETMEVMGDKLRARRAMRAAGVEVVPGTEHPLEDAEEARAQAETIGFPVALKAAAGGGGKGIRIVRSSEEVDSAFRMAAGEAQNAFGDGRLYLEKFLEAPRHVEIQLLADGEGRVVTLGERECSIQRRHQKLIEECPSPFLDPAGRKAMREAAAAAARAVGYHSAGTVEFLWSQGKFYFLEMNTRLQVEHAVTEEVFGVDLVEQMIRIGAGEPLSLPEAMQPRGHAIEVRLNSEDPAQGFAPSTGTIRNLRLPGGPGVRIDSALYSGMEVTPYYDPMLGKIIVWGATREQALRRMERALAELHIGGVETGAGLALEVLRDPRFIAGDYDTGFLGDFRPGPATEGLEEIAAVVAALHRRHVSARRALEGARHGTGGDGLSPWVASGRRCILSQGRRP
ncbi:MAG: acetyl/propionyl/methylcrotonyl-CoA carboxylase subunit alpha [Planctomycetota bacterium]